MTQGTGFCENCKKVTSVNLAEENYAQGCLLMMLTFGLYVFFRLFKMLIKPESEFKPGKCSECGNDVESENIAEHIVLSPGERAATKRNEKLQQLKEKEKSYKKKCPYCAEEIKKEAKICKHCNNTIE